MHKFDPAHMERLLSPERRRWLDPDAILAALGLESGMTLADVGCGPGFFTLPAAARVAPGGKVYALDIEPRMLERLRERAAAEGLTNVEAMLSEEDRLPLPAAAVDVALLVNVLHEARNPAGLLREVARILKPGGVLGVVEWRKAPMEMGPPVSERLSRQQVEELLREAGFASAHPLDAGPYHDGWRASLQVPSRT